MMRDIVSTLASTLRFRTFVTVLVATELVDDLRAEGTFDVFAPSDDAFAALPPQIIDSLFAEANLEGLIDFAEVHVQPRARRLFALTPRHLHVSERLVCTNGIIHVLDQIVLPLPTASDPAHKRQIERQPKPVDTRRLP